MDLGLIPYEGYFDLRPILYLTEDDSRADNIQCIYGGSLVLRHKPYGGSLVLEQKPYGGSLVLEQKPYGGSLVLELKPYGGSLVLELKPYGGSSWFS